MAFTNNKEILKGCEWKYFAVSCMKSCLTTFIYLKHIETLRFIYCTENVEKFRLNFVDQKYG